MTSARFLFCLTVVITTLILPSQTTPIIVVIRTFDGMLRSVNIESDDTVSTVVQKYCTVNGESNCPYTLKCNKGSSNLSSGTVLGSACNLEGATAVVLARK